MMQLSDAVGQNCSTFVPSAQWFDIQDLEMKIFLCATLLFNWDSPMGNSGRFPMGKPAATESRYPTNGACWLF